jgi:hypothetical protein
MTDGTLTLLAFGIALAVVVPLELWIRKRRRRPGWGMDRYIGLDGREWYYYRGLGPEGSAGDGGHGGGDGGCGH